MPILFGLALIAGSGLGVGVASAAVVTWTFDTGFANGGVIPDADPSGWQNSQLVSTGAGEIIEEVSVQLEFAGGWNGDLYVTLRHESGVSTGFAVLLNRVGTSSGSDLGYGNRGFGQDSLAAPFQLSDAGAYDVHFYQNHAPIYNADGQLTGTWKPDGSSLLSFRNLDPNGTWTLYATDMNGGDVSTLVSWGLRVETSSVPEPGNLVASLVAGAVLLLLRRK